MSPQGFGYIEPVARPEAVTYYRWEGKLHSPPNNPSASENDGIRASNVSRSLVDLARNFAYNYHTHQKAEAAAAGEPSYRLVFDAVGPPSAGATEEAGGSHDVKVRPLTAEEQRRFLEAFREANRQTLPGE